MSALDYIFVSHGRTLRLDVDLVAGWEPRAKTNSYCASCVFDLPVGRDADRSDFRTRAQVQLICRDSPRLAEPQILYCDERKAGLAVTGLMNQLRVDVGLFTAGDLLDGSLPWGITAERAKRRLHWRLDLLALVPGKPPGCLRYELQVLVVFSPPRNRPAPLSWDRGAGFFSAGLPTLGRR